MRKHGAQSAADRWSMDFLEWCSVSTTEAVHGVPGNRAVQAGDLVKLDVTV